MTALATIARLLSDPLVRSIILPLAKQVAEWVRGGKRPEWLDGTIQQVPELHAAAELAEAVRRRRAQG